MKQLAQNFIPKHILTSIFCLVAGASLSLAQNVPNGSFEDWIDVEKSSLDNWLVVGDVEKSTDATEGSSAVIFTNTVASDQFGLITSGPLINDKVTSVAYDEQPLSLRFNAKYNIAVGDGAQIVVLFSFKGSVLAYLSFDILGNSADTFRSFSLPITWQVSTQPDSVAYVISSRNLEEDQVYGDGYLIIDDFHFASISTRNKEIPNGNFETWKTTKTPSLTGWFTTDDYLEKLTGVRFPTPFVTQTTQSHSGKLALELTSRSTGAELAAGLAITGSSEAAFENPSIAINQKWKYLEGYYKYSPMNNDTALVLAALYYQGNVIAYETFEIGNKTDEFTYFAMPITYTLGLTPDSATVAFASADPDNPKGDRSKLTIDGVQFTNQNLSVFSFDQHRLKVYPNPVNDVVNISGLSQIEGAEYSLFNSLGQIVQSGIASKNLQVNMSGLAQGMYILNINGRYVNTSKLLFKE
ncbi:MAG: hypothetical protein ACI8ZN_002555 [Bacteroidia bacterium]|jgi:hypothetical protein